MAYCGQSALSLTTRAAHHKGNIMAGYKNRAMGRSKTLPSNSISWNPHQVVQGPGVGSSKGAVQSKAAKKGGTTVGKTFAAGSGKSNGGC